MKKNNGFTLLELMVTVAIIGLLASVAVPSFKKYQAKTISTEAKISLASFYVGENIAFTDWNTYVSCLYAVGVEDTYPADDYTLLPEALAKTSVRYYGTMIKSDDGTASWGNQFVRTNNLHPTCAKFNLGRQVEGLKYRNNAACKAAYANRLVAGDFSTWLASYYILTQSTFQAISFGFIGSCSKPITDNTNADLWTIDQNKVLTQVNVGY